MDLISNLPPPIIESILCLVPIKEAARTSILSKEWRYRWIKIPELVFKEDMFEVDTCWAELSITEESFDELNQRKEMTQRSKLFNAIYQVLFKHKGPIHEFSLSMDADVECVEIDHIIFYLLSNDSVKKLTLDIPWECRLPLSLFSLQYLTDLHLSRCTIDHLPPLDVLFSLANLYMELVTISKKTLLHLLAKCPLLKSVTLNNFDDIGVDDSTITNLFERLPMVESLSIYLWTVKQFIPDGVPQKEFPQKLPTALVHLKYVYVDYVCFPDKYGLYGLPFLAFLIRSSPNLEKLKLKISTDPMEEYDVFPTYKIDNYSDIWLAHLNELEILNFSNEKEELNFVKLILAKSPVLKKATLILWEEIEKDEALQIKRVLLPSSRASPGAKIIVKYWV